MASAATTVGNRRSLATVWVSMVVGPPTLEPPPAQERGDAEQDERDVGRPEERVHDCQDVTRAGEHQRERHVTPREGGRNRGYRHHDERQQKRRVPPRELPGP